MGGAFGRDARQGIYFGEQAESSRPMGATHETQDEKLLLKKLSMDEDNLTPVKIRIYFIV